jgi:hypothetical protein
VGDDAHVHTHIDFDAGMYLESRVLGYDHHVDAEE